MGGKKIELVLAKIEGFLKAFEWLNHKTNHGCRYILIKLPQSESVSRAMADRFGAASLSFQIQLVEAIEEELRKTLERFLFLFQEAGGDSLVDPKGSFTITHDWGRFDLLEELMADFRSLGITKVWRITPGSDCEELREWCFQDDLVVGYPGGFLILHLGVSD